MFDWEKNHWDSRYKKGAHSGDGSYGNELTYKLMWLGRLPFKSIVDVGCGDFNFGKNLLELRIDAAYLGLDISDYIIEKNKEKYGNDKVKFEVLGEEIPSGDLVLCVDVLFHIVEDKELKVFMEKLKKAWKHYLVITAYERDEEKTNHVRIRKFDPSFFGEPILRKVCEEEGEKYLYVFEK